MSKWTNWVKDHTTKDVMDCIINGCQISETDAIDALAKMWDESSVHIAAAVGQDFYEKYYPTNRHGPKWRGGRPKGIVDHYTTGVNSRGVLRWFSSEPREPEDGNTSAHVVIDREGIISFVVNPLIYIAWHARGVNSTHIGIENVNAGLLRKAGNLFYRRRGIPYPKERVAEIREIKGEYWEPYTVAQTVSNIILKRIFLAAIPAIKREHMIDHQIVNSRSRDCGPLWPLASINDLAITDLRFGDKVWTKNTLLKVL